MQKICSQIPPSHHLGFARLTSTFFSMDPHHIPPSLQRRWAEEVLYLHSLWHQGPPQNPSANPSPSPNLRPINCAQFKKPKNKRNQTRKNQSQATNPPPAPEIEWPVKPSPDRNAEPAGWPELAPNPHARPQLSAEERARASALWVQRAVLKSCREFLAGSDEDEEEDDVEEEDEEDAEAKAFEFFLGVFKNDEELRGYYVKSNEKGEFLCLVCGGTGVKLGKRYGDCVGLVQHSSSIGKTKRRGAHRGFGRAVCRVLGWDINRLPSIVLDRGEPLGALEQSLVKEGEMQEDLQEEDDVREIVEISNEDNSNLDLMDCIKERKIEILNKGDANHEKEELLNEDDEKIHQICSPSNTPPGEIFCPCEPSWRPKPDAVSWENLIPAPDDTQPRQPPSEEEQARVADAEVQQKALTACQDFLAKSDDSSSLDDDMDEEEVDKHVSLALNFFSMLFARNDDLRNYYEKNRSKGEFFCWVCWGIGKKTWKRFEDCLGLVQHSKSISSTKGKWAHQAFAKAVCQVLGWNIDGNPSIVLPSKESHAQHSEKSAKTQDDTSKDGSDDYLEETAVCGN